MDIEIERHDRGPRPSLGFEAKRLGHGYTLGGKRGYLSHEGLAAFFSGYYPTTHGDAGMLGYVQEKTNEHWSDKLARELASQSSRHRVAEGGELLPFNAEPTMPAFQSCHTDASGKPLFVIHVLLCFVG